MKTRSSNKIHKIIKTIVCLSALCGCFSGLVYAGSNTAAFLKAGVGARAMGMGGAFTAIADDASAGYWNPAGLGKIKRLTVSTMVQKLGSVEYPTLEDVTPQYQYASLLVPLGMVGAGKGTVGISWISNSLDNIALTTVDDSGQIHEDSFNDSENAYTVSYGRGLIDNDFYVGGSLTMVQQKFSKVADGSASGYGLSAGLMYALSRRLTAGLVIDSGVKMSWANGHEDKGSMRNKLGIGYEAVRGNKLNVLTAVDVIQAQDRPLEGHLGGEVGYEVKAGGESVTVDRMAFRMGIDGISLENRYGNQGMINENINWTMGAGFEMSIMRQTVGIDYSFGAYRLGPKHRISFYFMFL